MEKHPGFYRFNELNRANINRDYHIHTTWTDGSCSAQEMITAAEELGLESIAFTEHVRQDSTYYEDYFAEIDALRKNRQIEILIGIETKIMNLQGDMDVSGKYYGMAEIVLGSVHSIPHRGGFVAPLQLKKEDIYRLEHQHCVAMIKRGEINVLAHPAGMSIATQEAFPEEYLEEIIREIAQTEIAFEINARYINTAYFNNIIRFCREYNPYVSLGSDAHEKEELGKSRQMIQEIL